MGHIIQTKQASRASGGPQYYLHGLEPQTSAFLTSVGACPVWLGTPYGVVEGGLVAVAKDKVLRKGRLRDGRVGHHRIQRQSAQASVESQIRHWYGITATSPLYQVVFREITYRSRTTGRTALILLPEAIQLQGRRMKQLALDFQPLTFTQNHRSTLITDHLDQVKKARKADAAWAGRQIEQVLEDHLARGVAHVGEEDILRASGGLSKLGIHLAAYSRKGYDCSGSRFQMLDYPPYTCSVEIKKVSARFDYQILTRTSPERAAVLCLQHDPKFTPPAVVDVLDLQAIHEHLVG